MGCLGTGRDGTGRQIKDGEDGTGRDGTAGCYPFQGLFKWLLSFLKAVSCKCVLTFCQPFYQGVPMPINVFLWLLSFLIAFLNMFKSFSSFSEACFKSFLSVSTAWFKSSRSYLF